MDKQLSILGATGSVGTQALQLLESDKQYELIALTANENVEQLIAQCQKHRPKFAAIGNQKKHKQLKEEVAHLGH